VIVDDPDIELEIELDVVEDTLSDNILEYDTLAETEIDGLFENIALSDIVLLGIDEIVFEGELDSVAKLVDDPDILILGDKDGFGEDDFSEDEVFETLGDGVIVFETLEVLVLVLLAVEHGDKVEVFVTVLLPVEDTLTVLVLELVVVEDELTVDVVLAVLIGLFDDETEIEGLSDNEKLADEEADIDF
jgi:hypothetical protein